MNEKIESLQNTLIDRAKKQEEIEEVAESVAGEIRVRADKLREQMKNCDALCESAVAAQKKAAREEKKAQRLERDAEDLRGRMNEAAAPLKEWAMQQGGEDDCHTHIMQLLEIATSSEPVLSGSAALKALAETAGKSVSANSDANDVGAPWMTQNRNALDEDVFCRARNAYQDWTVDTDDADRERESAEAERESADGEKDRAIDDMKRTLDSLTQAEDWIEEKVSSCEGSAVARKARALIMGEINRKRAHYAEIRLELSKLSSDSLQRQVTHTAEMAAKCSRNKSSEDAEKHMRHNQAFQNAINKSNEESAKRHEELKAEAEEARKATEKCQAELQKVQEAQQRSQALATLRINEAQPSSTSAQQVRSRNSRPAPTLIVPVKATDEGKRFASSLMDPLGDHAQQLTAATVDIAAWKRNVTSVFEGWDAWLLIKEATQNSRYLEKSRDKFRDRILTHFDRFGNDVARTGKTLRQVNAGSPIAAEERVREAFFEKWAKAHLNLASIIDAWLESIRR